MPTKAEMAAAIRAKHPGAYDAKSDDELVSAWIAKYPVYEKQITDLTAKPVASPTMSEVPTTEAGTFWDGVLQHFGPDIQGAADIIGEVAQPEQMIPGLTLPPFLKGVVKPGLDKLTSAVSRNPLVTGGKDLLGQLGEWVGEWNAINPFKSSFGKAGTALRESAARGRDARVSPPLHTVEGSFPSNPPPTGGRSVNPVSNLGRETEVPYAGDTRPLWQQAFPEGQALPDRAPKPPLRRATGMESPEAAALDATARHGTPGNLNKAQAPEQSIEDVLKEMLAEPGSPITGTLPPSPGTVGEGALHQTGRFGRSGQLGAPGGYSSGRPGVTGAGYDDIYDRAIKVNQPGLGELTTTPGGTTRSAAGAGDAMREMSDDEFLAAVRKPQVDEWAPPISETELDPGGMADAAQRLRNDVGSRDAARMMGVDREAIRTMDAGRPSKTPRAAVKRINRHGLLGPENEMGFNDDDTLSTLLLGMLGGGTAMGSSYLDR